VLSLSLQRQYFSFLLGSNSVVDDLEDHQDKAQECEPDADAPLEQLSKTERAARSKDEEPLPGKWRNIGAILCLPGISPLDEAGGIALAQLF
jgi:hypothetical protein